jgi:hypothetical protein
VPLGTVKDLRLRQSDGLTFDYVWNFITSAQPIEWNRAQAYCLWELAAYDQSQQTSDFESLLDWRRRCWIGLDGVGRVRLEGKKLLFTPQRRWTISGTYPPNSYKYFDLAACAAVGISPD